MSKWERLNKELDDALNSITSEGWDIWALKFKQKQVNQDNMENRNKPAFSVSLKDNGNPSHPVAMGLTKREYFAIQIATGLSVRSIPGRHNGIDEMEVEVPLYAVRLADALLKALESKSE